MDGNGVYPNRIWWYTLFGQTQKERCIPVIKHATGNPLHTDINVPSWENNLGVERQDNLILSKNTLHSYSNAGFVHIKTGLLWVFIPYLYRKITSTKLIPSYVHRFKQDTPIIPVVPHKTVAEVSKIGNL